MDANYDVRQRQVQLIEQQLRWREQLKKVRIPRSVVQSEQHGIQNADLESRNEELSGRVRNLTTALETMTLQCHKAQEQLIAHAEAHIKTQKRIQLLVDTTNSLKVQLEHQKEIGTQNTGMIEESMEQFQTFTDQFC